MIIVRPIHRSDYNDLYQLAAESGHGFTSLPLNEKILQHKITLSSQAFQNKVSNVNNGRYLFVIEDTDTGKVVGTSAIHSAVGLEDAFYHYHLSKVVHSSHELKIYNTVDLLTLCNDYTGASELCSLFLSSDYRKNKNGSLLSKARFSLMAEHPNRFSQTVIAEMRGVSDANGRSPFWHWLEEHFFSIDFPTADYLSGIGKKAFIAELMPKFPIYVSLLNKAAQAVIAKVHKNTEAALKILEKEGFSYRGYVDIFDAGPTVEAKLKDINSIKNSHKYQVIIGNHIDGDIHIITNLQFEDFRAIQVKVDVNHLQNTLTISKDSAVALHLCDGDWARLLSNKL
mgnify:CR=1 FL=1